MKKVIIILCIVAVVIFGFIFFTNSKKTQTVAKAETTVAQTTQKQTEAANPAPLSKDDLTIKEDGKESNIVDNANKAIATYGPGSNAETNRGIKVGDTQEKVWAKYGEIEISPISRRDIDIYDYLKNHSDTDQRIKDALDDGSMYAKYVYHDNNDGKDYAVGFWFDPENKVKWIFNYEEGLTSVAELESMSAEAAKQQQ